MSVAQLLTSLSLADSDGNDVPLLTDTRAVQSATGLVGIASREVVIVRSGRRGSRNLTRWRDDGQVVITGTLVGADAADTWAQYDAVAGVFADAVDTDRVLKWTAGQSLALQRNVRLTSLAPAVDVGPDIIAYQATLRASDPNVYSQTLQTASGVPLGSTAGGGLEFRVTIPVHFNAPASSVAAFDNQGFVPTPPTFVLAGYLQNPTVELVPGTELVFTGTIADGDTLTIDVDQRSILLNGVDNRRSMLVTSQSTWFDLPPGSGTVTLLATDFAPGANLTMTWRDARD